VAEVTALWGVIGMEHGNSLAGRSGEERLVAAYREIDRG
jgi:hydroxypyruvate isomerase